MSIEIISNTDNILNAEVKSSNTIHISDALMNTIRKICISHIPTFAIAYDKYNKTNKMNIIKNDSSTNNDFVGNRLALIPIQTELIKMLVQISNILNNKFDKKKLKHKNIKDILQNVEFEINLVNKTPELLTVTTEHIMPYINGIKLVDLTSEDIDKIKEHIDLFDIFPIGKQLLEDLNNLEEFKTKLVALCFNSKIITDKLYHVLITKLKPNDVFHIKMVVETGIGLTHTKWSSVCPATYNYKKDDKINIEVLNEMIIDIDKEINLIATDDEKKQLVERYQDIHKFTPIQIPEDFNEELKKLVLEKDRKIHGYNIFDSYRDYVGKDTDFGKIYEFMIESNGSLPSERILYKSLKVLKSKIKTFYNLLKDIEVLPYTNTELNIVLNNNYIEITFDNKNEFIGYLFSSYIYYFDELNSFSDPIEFVGFSKLHPLDDKYMIKIKTLSKLSTIMSITTNKLLEIINHLIKVLI
tara:strand:+ start:6289 stop:7698 length:1410 start_codon:yes stop_codon:yes gene_type:complete